MISIFEDDKEVWSAICNLLESAGLSVEAFESAEEFVESGPTDKKTHKHKREGMYFVAVQRCVSGSCNLWLMVFDRIVETLANNLHLECVGAS